MVGSGSTNKMELITGEDPVKKRASAQRLTGRNLGLLYVFSSSTDFESERGGSNSQPIPCWNTVATLPQRPKPWPSCGPNGGGFRRFASPFRVFGRPCGGCQDFDNGKAGTPPGSMAVPVCSPDSATSLIQKRSINSRAPAAISTTR